MNLKLSHFNAASTDLAFVPVTLLSVVKRFNVKPRYSQLILNSSSSKVCQSAQRLPEL